MSRPSRRVAVARLRRLARYLDRLPREDYDQADADQCVIGHARCLFKLPNARLVGEHLGIPCAAIGSIISPLAPVRTPRGKAQQLRALAARLAQEE